MVVRYITLVMIILVIGAGLYESIYGLLQEIGVCMSNHSAYKVTGSFYNPGPLGCYLSLSFPLIISLLFSNDIVKKIHTVRLSKAITASGYVALIIMAVVLPATMSRTGWLAAAVGFVIVMIPMLRKHLVANHNIRRLSIGVALTVGICFIIGATYRLKQVSADGRFLMWKVAGNAISQSPFQGVGIEKVAGTYAMAQEDYFASGAGSVKEIMAADCPVYVFNEYLQTGIAYGWGWMGLLILMVIAAFIIAMSSRHYGIAGSVAAAGIIMFASYPFQFPISVVTIVAIMIIAFLSAGWKWYSLGMICITAGCGNFLIKDVRLPDIGTPFSKGLAFHQDKNWNKSNEVLLNLLQYTSDPMPLNIIGKNYREMEMWDSAAYYFQRSINRCPNRLYPHYLLMNLYADSLNLQYEKAIEEANILLTMDAKIGSPAVDEMRQEANKIIKNLNHYQKQ